MSMDKGSPDCPYPGCFFCVMKEGNPSKRKASILKFFRELPSQDDDGQVLPISGLWNTAMAHPNDPEFIELGIFECMAALIWKGLKNRRWLSHDQNIYIPYYAAHIIGSYTMNMEEFAETSVHAGVIPALVELLRGRLTWVEQRVAVRALGHLATYASTFAAVSSHGEILELSMQLAMSALEIVYSHFYQYVDRRLSYHCDLLTRGMGGVEMESRKAEEWASQLQCWSLQLINCFAFKPEFLPTICQQEFLIKLPGMWGGLVNENSPAGIGLLRTICHHKLGRGPVSRCPGIIDALCNIARSSDDWQYMAIDCLLWLLQDPNTCHKIELFYNGLNGQTRTTVDAAACGTIFAKSPGQAYDLLEEMTINSYQWPSERAGVKQPAGVYAVDPITSLAAQVSVIATQIAAMNKGNQSFSNISAVSTDENPNMEEAQYVNNHGYGGYRGNSFPNTYHPGLRNHENFSYANNKNVLNPPSGFNTSNGEGKPSFEDLVGTFVTESGKRMARTESRLDSMELHMTNMGATMKSLETQMRQLTTAVNSQTSGMSSSNNAGINFKEVNVIFVSHDENKKMVEQEDLFPSKVRRGMKGKEEVLISDIDISRLPYPQRYFQFHAKSHNDKVLENSKDPPTNIHVAAVESEKVTEDSLEVTQRKLPPKLEDPGMFSIPCSIEGQCVEEALCDLGAGVNVMSTSLYNKLGMTEMKRTEVILKLADGYVLKPDGLVEDVNVKVDKLILPADFIVLDMKEDPKVPIILGRPFLATAKAEIDMKKGELKMEVDGRRVKFRLVKSKVGKVGEQMDKNGMTYDPP